MSVPGTLECKPQAPQTGWWWNTERRRARLLDRGAGQPHLLRRVPLRQRRALELVRRDGIDFARRLALHRRPARRGRRRRRWGRVSRADACAERGPVHARVLRRVQRHDDVARRHGGHRALQHRAERTESPGRATTSRRPDGGGTRRRAAAASSSSGRTAPRTSRATCTTTRAIRSGTSRSSRRPTSARFTGNWWLYANGQSLTGPYRPATRINDNVAPVTIQFTSATTATMTLPERTHHFPHEAPLLMRKALPVSQSPRAPPRRRLRHATPLLLARSAHPATRGRERGQSP